MTTLPPELLTGFVAEAYTYLAALRTGLADYQQRRDQAMLDTLSDQADILHGGVEMLGLESVTALAASLAASLTALPDNGATEPAFATMITDLLDQIEAELATTVAVPRPENDDSGAGEAVATASPAATPVQAAQDLDLPPELLDIFSLETAEHFQAIARGLVHLRDRPDDGDTLSDVRRVTHTLKGAAAAIGFSGVAHLAHLMEEALELALDGRQPLTPTALDLLFDSGDALDHLLHPQPPGSNGVNLAALDDRYRTVLGNAYPYPDTSPTPEREISEPAQPAAPRADDVLRLPLAVVDQLVNRVGELIINRTGMEQLQGALRSLISELTLSTRRLQRVVHELDAQIETTLPASVGTAAAASGATNADDALFDLLEMDRYTLLYQLTRELEEIATDTGDLNGQFRLLADDLDVGLTRERRLTTELQDGLLTTRLVPFDDLEMRLRRTVLRTARDVGKTVDLILTGFDTKVDKTVIDALADPLMHLLRNAVDHGLEDPAARQAAGKPAVGLVTVQVERERGRVILTLRDDGAGIDPDRVYRQAVAQGLLSSAEDPSTEQLYDVLFTEGFSLAEILTETSGRGVGLDIVRRAVNRLQGTVRVDSSPGQGTTFTLSVPVTLAITQALFVRSANQQFAIPLEQVSMVLRLEDDLTAQIKAEDVLRYNGRNLAVFDLSAFVQGTPRAEDQARYGLVIEQGSPAVVVLIDGMVGVHDAVIKPLGTHLRRVHGVVGATIAGDGRVTLVLDIEEIITADLPAAADDNVHHAGVSRSRFTPHVLVVDDSPSVRRVVCAFLERMGWQTTSARDGIDALDQLDQFKPDVALVDIEMPRMNGYELLSRIKSDPRWEQVPVVFLTSRAAAKHRDRAQELQVDGYLVKPYRENELIDTLMQAMQTVRE